jgi:hypothetical protein
MAKDHTTPTDAMWMAALFICVDLCLICGDSFAFFPAAPEEFSHRAHREHGGMRVFSVPSVFSVVDASSSPAPPLENVGHG